MTPSKGKTSTQAPEAAAAVDGSAVLRRIFSALEAEVAANPALRERLAAEIAAELVGAPAPAAPQAASESSKTEAAVDASEAEGELVGVNPIAVIDEEGPEALRDELRFMRRKEPLVRLAKAYALDVPQKLLKKQMPVWRMIDAIIEAAERRVREQRLSAG